MCDIYTAKCRVCGKEIEMHLGNWNTKRSEVRVYCGAHLEKALLQTKPVSLWRFKRCLGGKRWCGVVAVVLLTPTAKRNGRINHPNKWESERICQFEPSRSQA